MAIRRIAAIVTALAAAALAWACLAPTTALADEGQGDAPTADDNKVTLTSYLLGTDRFHVRSEQVGASKDAKIEDIIRYEAKSGTVVVLKANLLDAKDGKSVVVSEKALLLTCNKPVDVTDKAKRSENGEVTNLEELREAVPQEERGKTIHGTYIFEMPLDTTELGGTELKADHEVLYASDDAKASILIGTEDPYATKDKKSWDSVYVIDPQFTYTPMVAGEGEVFKVHVKVTGLKPNQNYRGHYCVGPKGHNDEGDMHVYSESAADASGFAGGGTSDQNGVLEYDIVHKGTIPEDEQKDLVVRFGATYANKGGIADVEWRIDPETGDEIIDNVTSSEPWTAIADKKEFALVDLVKHDNAVNAPMGVAPAASSITPTVSATVDAKTDALIAVMCFAMASALVISRVVIRRKDEND